MFIYIHDLANARIQSDLIIITGLNMKEWPIRSNPVCVCVCYLNKVWIIASY